MLALFVVMLALGPTAPVVETPPGLMSPVVAMELAGDRAEVFDVIGPPGHPGRPAAVEDMRFVTRVDFVFLLAYSAIYVAIVQLLRARGAAPAWVGPTGYALAATMAIGDVMENLQILRLLDVVEPEVMAPALVALRTYTLIKWNAIFAASALLAPWMWRSGVGGRASGAFFALAAVCGFVGVIHHPAIEWSMLPTGLAWAGAWIWALRARPA